MCIGCGACAVVSKSIQIVRDRYGFLRPNIPEQALDVAESAAAVCPFTSTCHDENILGDELFGESNAQRHPAIGHFRAIFAGRVSDEENLLTSSSGGLTTWVCMELLNAGHIDGIVHVGAKGDEGDLFTYCISTTVEQLLSRKKSQYYSVSFEHAVCDALNSGKRFAFIGVPCYVKAIRLLSNERTEVKEAFPYAFALVCGHMKSPAFAESLAWQVGVPPDKIRAVDFRVKNRGKPVHDYSFEATSIDGKTHSAVSNSLFGALWGHAAFQLNACDFCDDIFGETGDACFGDAWLGKFSPEWRGTNIVVVRNPLVASMLTEGNERGEIAIESLSTEELIESQAGNFRHRWDGLSERLKARESNQLPVPKKRIRAGSRPIPPKRVEIVRLRQEMAKQSHISFLRAKQERNLDIYIREMSPLASRMSALSKASFGARVTRKLKSAIKKIFGYLA